MLSKSKLGSVKLIVSSGMKQDGLRPDSSESWINTLEKEMNSIELIPISCHLILIGRILVHKYHF